ncbi:MAG: PAS domain S-box protein [Caulobacteraceae bacterium]
MPRPLIPTHLRERWRDVVETAADILGAGAVLIVQVVEDQVEALAVSLRAQGDDWPADRAPLAGSLYEAVLGTSDGLALADVRADGRWMDHDVGGVVSCLGLPVRWPDGTAFGAICALDREPRTYPEPQARLFALLRDGVETELALLAAKTAQRTPSLEDINEQRNRLLAENLVDGFFLHDEEGRILDVNSLACRNIGYSREELLDMRIWEVTTSDPADLKALWDNAHHAGGFSTRLQYRRKDGVIFPADVRVSCLETERGKLFLAMARNIATRLDPVALMPFGAEPEQPDGTERTQRWRRSSELLQAVMDGAADAIFIKDVEGRYLLFNRAAEGLFGQGARDALGKTAGDLIGQENGRQIRALEQRVMRTGVSSTVEETLFTGGREFTFLATRSPYWNAKGEVVGLIGILHDITEMRRAAQALRDSEVRWEFAVTGAGDGIWDWNMQTGHVFYSRRWKAMLGYADEEIGESVEEWSSRVHPDELGRCWEIIERHFAGETPDFVLEHRMRAKDGSWRWILDRGKAIERGAGDRPTRVIGTHTDITQRKNAEDELHLQRERLLLATEASRLGVWDHNLDADTLICDARWYKIFGLPPLSPKAAVTAFDASVHPEDSERVARERDEMLASGQSILRREFRICRPGGETRWVASASRLIEGSESGPRRLVGIVRDITEEREAAEALQTAKETAEAAERAKSDFLATMSHEIRTPMNTVIGMTRLTLNSELTPKQRNYLEKIDASAKTLLGIINDILDFSKIEAGGLQLEDTEFTLEAVLESMAALTAVRAEEKGLEIVYAIAPSTPRRLRGDPLRLGQVLTNLVSNAVKFTEVGEVVVSIDLVSLEDGEAALRFAVRDTGIGLDPDQVAGLFRRFSQAEAHTSRQYGGTGLGLAISKQLVEMMGGDIWVDSERGKGSTFHFTIKAALPEAASFLATAPRSLTHLAGRRVLIVDDNASAREILSEMVRSFGMLVQTVESGAKALTTLRAASRRDESFDLVLMDWRMPTMDGLETARRIRAERTLSRLPAVLMVTAYGREEVLKSAERIGLQGVLIKPVTESVMFNTLQDILMLTGQLHPEGETRREAAIRRGAPMEARELSVLRGLKVLVVDDNALNREVATDFLLAVGMVVETAVNGRDALKQLETGVYDAVLMDVHMPEMDGLAAVREIRRREAWAELPIVALTAQARVEDRTASLEAGMTAHLTKPIDEGALYRTLMRVLDLQPLVTDAAEADPATEKAKETLGASLRGFDAAAALRRFGGDKARLDRLLEGFLHDFDDAGGRFGAHLEAGELDGIAALAHAMRGAAGYLEASAFCVVAEQVESAARRGEVDAVQAYAPIFTSLTDRLLRQVRASRFGSEAGAGPGEGDAGTVDLAAVLSLTAEAEPLIARGDYAAQSLLDRLCATLAGRPEAAFATLARTHYEDLELEAANLALAQLNAQLRSAHAGGLQ